MKSESHSFKVGRTYGRYTHVRGDSAYTVGVVFTDFGIVSVYTQPGTRAFTVLEFVFEGTNHGRKFRKTFTERGLSTIAGRFAREIAG